MSLFGGDTNYFGLDIGANSVRVVQLRGGGAQYTLEAFGSAPLPVGLVESESKLDLQKIAKLIETLIEKTGINTKNVVSAIPGTSVFNTVVKLPPMSSQELEKAIKYQAEQNIPLKLEEVKYDWEVIKEDPQSKELTVMIIAAAKSKVEHLMELFTMANLNVIALETATVAMARSLSTQNDPLVMILDVGATTTEIAVVENGILTQTRSFPLSGFAMTRAVSKGLGLEMEQAEQFKRRFGLSQDKLEGQVYRAIEPILRNILDEAVRSAKFYQEQFGKEIGRIILTGGSSRLPLIMEYIKNYTGMEVVEGNPWSKVSYKPAFSDKLNEVAPEFSVAVGLGMRD